ncbi:hypothetical protein GARC_4072 [Paraglaciecola arctica BSs20135]|uniref:Uncharacterized protein n=1 Tax=Paraglaciecola arctica BSs20135 TaxID=493475 RepID=K6XK32_9ALTE|nr:hypothetical protein GARC_4072 [Paraglaciecola arctica BSs20135]
MTNYDYSDRRKILMNDKLAGYAFKTFSDVINSSYKKAA